MLGTPWAPPDCDYATDATGSIAIRKAIMNLIGSPLDSVWFVKKSTLVLFLGKNFYSSTKRFIKKFLASINICSRI